MHSYAIAVIAAIAAGICAPAAEAQDAQSYNANGFQRLCQEEDLVNHVFLMVDFHQTPVRKESRWMYHFRYAYLKFVPNNYFSELQSNRPVKTSQQVEKMLQHGWGKYTLSKDGVLNLIKDDKIEHSFRCVAVLKPYAEYIKRDLILTGYTKKRKSELYELYRLWY